ATATTHYNGVCESCHAVTIQKAAGPHARGADCTGCHMPKRRTDDVVHVVMTDHLIQRQKPAGDPIAAKPEIVNSAAALYRGEIAPAHPARLRDASDNAFYVAAGQVRNRRNLDKGLPQLASLLGRDHPAQAGFYSELGQGYTAAQKPAEAIPYFEEAAKREP